MKIRREVEEQENPAHPQLMNPQPRRQRGEKAVHDRLYHAGQVSLANKMQKQRKYELEAAKPHRPKLITPKQDNKPVIDAENMQILTSEFDLEEMDENGSLRRSPMTRASFKTAAMSARLPNRHGESVQEGLYNLDKV